MTFDPVADYVDLQVNGYVGIDFNDPQTTQVQLQKAAHAMQADGVHLALPTVITASLASMCRCIENLVELIRSDEIASQIFGGIHIEGPFLSPKQGFIGAHPVEHAQAQDLTALASLCDVGGELTRIVTLAPEVDRQGAMTRFCVERGIHVAAGHTDASLAEIECCIEAGLSLFTHLGNGCPRLLDRHDNIILRALRYRDHLTYSVIADGFHIPKMLFHHFLDWIERDQLLVVSDAISAAGLGPGIYRLGDREVKIGADKAARDPSGEHFVGAASTMRDADRWLADAVGLSRSERQRLLAKNPLRWLTTSPRVEQGRI